jgi:8-oxo-dGTP pyrophosphatase MutT (NUDIX family)
MSKDEARRPPGGDPPPHRLFRLAQRLFLFSARITRGMTLGVRGMVLDQNGCIFLVRHSYVRGWHMPGGGVEPGETMLDALTKELSEEGNIEIEAAPALLGIYLNRKASQRDHVAVYVVRSFRCTGPRQADREILEARFFPLDALPDGITAATRRRIAEALDGAPLCPHW